VDVAFFVSLELRASVFCVSTCRFVSKFLSDIAELQACPVSLWEAGPNDIHGRYLPSFRVNVNTTVVLLGDLAVTSRLMSRWNAFFDGEIHSLSWLCFAISLLDEVHAASGLSVSVSLT
jgi:hypothetical protein